MTEVTTVPAMDWRTRLRIIADAAVAAVQACRRPDPAAEASRNEQEHERLAQLYIETQPAPRDRSSQ